MYLVGLTGGIAAGKSSVAKRWVELGGHEIDADVLARQALEVGSAGLAKVVEAFGSELLLPDGTLNRQMLAEIVFNSPEKRKELEAIVHPIVRRLAADALAKLDDGTIAIYTVPLLVEASVELPFDYVVNRSYGEKPRPEPAGGGLKNRFSSECSRTRQSGRCDFELESVVGPATRRCRGAVARHRT